MKKIRLAHLYPKLLNIYGDGGNILTLKKRCEWRGIGIEIDEINILNASFLAMHRAVDGLKLKPQHLLIDGNRFKKYQDVPHTTVVKGDGKYLSIAAASILAKTYRDDYMKALHEEYPYYDWSSNKGYPTKKHRAAIREYGTTPYHRMTFNLLGEDSQLELQF